jgi:hypothetical protein
MRQIVGRKLWIGNAGDLRDPRAVCAAGIEAIVELADNEQLATLPRDLIRLRFPLSDGGANNGWVRFNMRGREVAVTACSDFPGARFTRTFDIADFFWGAL